MSGPRDYYVSMVRGGRYALLAGPFLTHAEALEMVKPARDEAERLDPRSHFDAFGTCSLPCSRENKMGRLNVYIGAKPRVLVSA
jgi:hypothetical protein